MTFSHASTGVNVLDGVYAALVAFVLTGVIFAVLRILPRPRFVRGTSPSLRTAKVVSAAVLIAGAAVFGAVYTGLVTTAHSTHTSVFIP